MRFGKALMWLMVIWLVVGCTSTDDEPFVVPTRANQESLRVTLGLPPEAAIAETETARVPTITATLTASNTPTETPDLPTLTPSNMPTSTDRPTATTDPISGTITRIAELTVLAQTATAPTFTPSITPTATNTATITPTPSNTFAPLPTLPENPDPNAIIFASNRAGTHDIWVMTVNGEPSRPLVTDNSNDFMAACDPRGELLVFESDRDGDRELFVSDYDGSGLRTLTESEGENIEPIWSPTGEFLAFVSTRSGDANIWLVNREGTNFRQITLPESDEIHPSWSRDGSVLFYSANRDDSYDIFQFNLEDNAETQITFTPDIDEFHPTLSPNFQNIAYIAEATPGQPDTAVAYVLDSNGFVREVAATAGAIETPYWLDDQRLLLAADLGGQNVQVVLADVLSAEDPRVLTDLGDDNRWPRYCYIDPVFFATLPTVRPTPILRPTIPTSTPVTPTLTPSVTPTPTPLYEAFAEPDSDWLLSRETWTGEEFAFIAPDFLPADTRGFQVGNLLNLAWDNNEGTNVVTLALEPFRGELAATLIGFTINDLPAFPPDSLVGIEEAITRALLRNSVRNRVYSLTDVSFTDVNITLSFRVPPLQPRSAPSAYRAFGGDTPNGWLISTERWSAEELGTLASISGISTSVLATFVGDQVQYRWVDGSGDANVLLVRYLADDGDLVVNPISYTVNETILDVDADILYRLREVLLTNSVAEGDFSLSRIEGDVGAFELVLLVPPTFKD